jgi:hypothetical protein
MFKRGIAYRIRSIEQLDMAIAIAKKQKMVIMDSFRRVVMESDHMKTELYIAKINNRLQYGQRAAVDQEKLEVREFINFNHYTKLL